MKRFILLITAFFLMHIGLQAVPAYRQAHTFTQPNGEKVMYYLVGDEHYHAYYSMDGYMLQLNNKGVLCYAEQGADGRVSPTSLQAHDANLRVGMEKVFVSELKKINFNTVYQAARRNGIKAKEVTTDFPTTGNIRGIVLLVSFADNTFSMADPQPFFYSQMNDSAYTVNGATGSARYYFKDQSMNKFSPTFDVVGPIKLKKDLSYYGSNMGRDDANAADMVVEACQFAHDSLGVDFSKYDNDNDGNVDFVYIRYAGYGESYGASSNTIWPHSSNIYYSGKSLTLDGKAVGKYACSCELRGTSGNEIDNIGTFCHEFGHVLGLPDFYQTNGSGQMQLGPWSIMDYGCYNNKSKTPPAYSAFERYSLGWLKFTDIDTVAAKIVLPELTENNTAYRLTTGKENEYFLLESRQQKGWDAAQPATGLMITHIDYDAAAWAGNYVNNNSTHPRYNLLTADNTKQYDNDEGYLGDLFPGSTNNISFTDETTPNSLQWDGTPTKKDVTGIRNENGVVTFDFMMKKLATPLALPATEVTEKGFTANWQPVNEAKAYTLFVYPHIADSLKMMPIEENFNLLIKGNYPNADTTNIADSLDNYFSSKGWTGNYIYQAGNKCKIGDYQKYGSLNTPVMDLSSNEGEFTVAFTARAFTGRILNYYVTATDVSNASQIQKETLKGNDKENTILLHFKGGCKQTKLTLTTKNDRLFIDNFRVVKGNVDSTKVWQVSNPRIVVNGITGNNYPLKDVTPGISYSYSVQAVSDDSLYNSNISNEIMVEIPSTGDGLSSLNANSKITISGKTLHLFTTAMALPVAVYEPNGALIYYGTVYENKDIELPHTGFYIVRLGENNSKIMIK